MNCREYREIVAAHVDGVLAPEENQTARSHLTDCAACQKVFHWESMALRSLKEKMPVMTPPAGAKERLLDRLETQQRRRQIPSLNFLRTGMAGGIAVVAFILLGVWLSRDNDANDILSDAVAQHEKFVAQGPGADRGMSEPSPAARRLDLTLLGYRVAADRIDRVNGRERRLSVFAKEGNEFVLAQEFEGVDLIPLSEARGIRIKSQGFVAFTQGKVSLVAWQDNRTLCVLTSQLPAEKLISLAERVAGRS